MHCCLNDLNINYLLKKMQLQLFWPVCSHYNCQFNAGPHVVVVENMANVNFQSFCSIHIVHYKIFQHQSCQKLGYFFFENYFHDPWKWKWFWLKLHQQVFRKVNIHVLSLHFLHWWCGRDDVFWLWKQWSWEKVL